MAIYSYSGLGGKGQKVTGQVEAPNEKEAVRSLRTQSIFVEKIREGTEGASLTIRQRIVKAFQWINPKRFLPVFQGDLIVFFHQIALMLRAGYTLVPALAACREMQTKVGMIRMMDRLSGALRGGTSLSAAMKKEARLFTPMIVNLVAVGERSGNLDSILDRLSENLESMKDLRRQLLSAMLYPSIVLISSFGLVAYMVTTVIPRFSSFLTSRGSELPPSTQMLLDISGWAEEWGTVVGISVGVSLFLILAAYTTASGKRVLDEFLLRVPLVGTSIQFSSMAQTGWSLSLLLRSGVPALDALRINAQAMSSFAMRDRFNAAADELLTGRALSTVMNRSHIPPMMRHMVAVGEKSGDLDTVMFDVGAYYQKELAAKVKLMSAMIEPVMIISVGGIVGFVYFSIFQAVMSVSKGGM